ncbi:MAG: hypothetical protein IJS40_03130 [Synergistaceae bacterium]|nr:hypothetical protein [Synergistaceae bacterium]
MYLPYWSSELQVEIPSWFPWGKDYQPVSVNRFHDDTLKRIAELSFDLESEFLFLSSPLVGYVGNLSREKFFKETEDNVLNLGFLMVFSFSENIEKALILSLIAIESAKNLQLGVTTCSLWRGGIYEGKTKIVAIASDEPFYDCSEYLKGLVNVLDNVKIALRPSALSYYAEKFGYDRFLRRWEKANPYDVRVTQILSELDTDSAKEIVGGSPMIDFPSFFGLALTAVQQ